MTIEISQLSHLAQAGFYGISPLYLVIIGVSFLASMLISGMLKRRFSEYSQIPIRMTGAEVAEAMLRQNGITDVKVISVPGQLTDHYDPVKKTVNLSEPVYHINSVAAAAVGRGRGAVGRRDVLAAAAAAQAAGFSETAAEVMAMDYHRHLVATVLRPQSGVPT
jgi:hypothetical protein